MITAKKIDEIASIIASRILHEKADLAKSEKERQELVSKQISDDDLEAPANSKEETITDEAEDDEDEGSDAEDVEAKTKPKDSEEEKGDTEDFAVQAPDVVPAELSFSQIKKQINNLRAGKSLKDEEISTELEDYFDELGPGEKSALFTYLASIGAILTGGTQGEDAPRPYNLGIDITAPKEDKENKTPEGEPEPVVGPDGEEVAPIVVGELADKTKEYAIMLEGISAGDSHRCMNGKIVDFGSSACVTDIGKRIDDAAFQRDNMGRGSADRSSMNGALKYLRQKMRKAQKIQNQDNEEKVQGKLNLADSA